MKHFIVSKQGSRQGKMTRTKYIRYDAYLGTETEITKAQFERKIRSKYVFPVWDEYLQQPTEAYYDSRDSILRIFYWKSETEEE